MSMQEKGKSVPKSLLLWLLKTGVIFFIHCTNHIIMPSVKISFYKILTDLSSKFELPAEFTSKHREILPRHAKLRIASGAMWRVLVEQLEEENYYLTRGWLEFSQDMDLQILEILVFTYVGDDTFHVCAYAANAFEKESNFLTFRNPPEPNPTPSNLRFQVTLTKTYIYLLYVPKGLAEEWGLMGKKRMRLEYGGRKKSCSARVKVTSKLWRGQREMVYLSTGWSNFCKANGIVIGRTYEVEFVPDKDLIRINPLPTNTT